MSGARRAVLISAVWLLWSFAGHPAGLLCAQEAGGAQPAEAHAAERRTSERKADEAVKPDGEGGAEVDENDAYRHSAMVQKIGRMAGMSTETAADVFEWLNFAVLAAGIGYVMVKVLPKSFRARSSAIQKELVDARVATEEASVRLNSVEDRLAKLDGQIAEMRSQAERDMATDEVRIKAQLEEEKKKIMQSAEQEIAAASMQAQRQLQNYAAEMAIEQAAKKLVVSAETDRLLVQNFARRLGGDGSPGGQN